MAALSVLILVGLEDGWRGIDTQVDDIATLREHVERPAHITEADLVETIRTTHDDTQLSLSAQSGDEINIPLVTEGDTVDATHGVWIDDGYAHAHSFVSGDTATVSPGAVEQTILIRGDTRDLADQARDALGAKYTSYTDRESNPHVATAFERVSQIRSLALTPTLSRFVLSTQSGSFSLPTWEPVYSVTSVLLPVVLAIACIAASWSATHSMRRMSPAEGLRPDVGQARCTPLERASRLWRRIGYGSRWSLHDATTSPVSVFLGIIATAGCMMLLVAGFGVPDTLGHQVQTSYSQQYRYDTRILVSTYADETVRAQLSEQDGQWIQQTSAQITGDDQAERTLTVMGSGDLFNLLDKTGSPLPEFDGAVVSAQLADTLGLAVGDDMFVTLSDGTEAAAQVTAIAHVSEPQGVTFTRDVWEDAGANFDPNAYLTAAPIEDDLAALPGVVDTVSLSEQRDNAQSLVDSLTSVFTLIKVFAVILSVVVLYNLGAMSFTERVRVYATLRMLGFHHSELRSLAGRENIATTLVGWLIGIPAGWVWASVITIVFAMTATALLTHRITSIDMTSALKGVE